MLDTLVAVRFDRPLLNGKTNPSIMSGCRDNGEQTDIVAKFSASCEQKTLNLATEAICAMLATDLQLPVPEPFVVNIDEDFVELITDSTIRDIVSRSCNTGFGSKFLPPGYSTWSPESPIEAGLLKTAVSIYAFDALIQNVDRKPNNPNCLTNGLKIAMIDHDIALITDGILLWKPPWEKGGLNFIDGPDKHIFYSEIKGNINTASHLNSFKEAWAVITEERLNEYFDALPIEWANHANTKKMIDYLCEVKTNLDAAIKEIEIILL